MNYEFRLWEELGWAVGIAVLTVLATSLAFDTAPEDWETWGVSVGIGIARAAIGAALTVARQARG